MSLRPYFLNGPSSCSLLPLLQEQALPEVPVLPRRAGPEDPYLRLREEEVRRGRVPYGCSHGVGRVRAGLRREAFHMCDSRHLILAEIHIELPLAEELLKLAQ